MDKCFIRETIMVELNNRNDYRCAPMQSVTKKKKKIDKLSYAGYDKPIRLIRSIFINSHSIRN